MHLIHHQVCLSTEHSPSYKKPLALWMWPWFCSPHSAGESSSQRESCLLPLHLPTARCIRMRLDYAKYLFTHLWAKKDRNRDMWHERALSLFAALVTRLLSLCFVVLWPYFWSDANRLQSLRTWMSRVMQCKPCPICHFLDGKCK